MCAAQDRVVSGTESWLQGVCTETDALESVLSLCRHVAVIYIALCIFAFLIYAAPSSASPLGSISKVS